MTSDLFYESFLNSTSKKIELEKVKKIHSEILENFLKIQKKPKRKSPKKSKLAKTEDVDNANVEVNIN